MSISHMALIVNIVQMLLPLNNRYKKNYVELTTYMVVWANYRKNTK